MGWPQILGAWTAEIADGAVRAVRQDGAGYVKVEAPLPAVVTVVPGALKPRYPNGRRLINIYKGVGEIAAAWSAGKRRTWSPQRRWSRCWSGGGRTSRPNGSGEPA
jgi:electron transfer flavoprotein alpha/beta subunit